MGNCIWFLLYAIFPGVKGFSTQFHLLQNKRGCMKRYVKRFFLRLGTGRPGSSSWPDNDTACTVK